jgi:hypothetical protein
MGSRGPAPKRDAQRRRRNTVEPATTAVADGVNRAPKLTGAHSAVAKRFWQNLGVSAQAAYFQPSDWSYAELVVHAIDQAVKYPSANMVRAAMDGMSRLLVTEADRRRVRMELSPAEAVDPEETAANARVLKLIERYEGDDDSAG